MRLVDAGLVAAGSRIVVDAKSGTTASLSVLAAPEGFAAKTGITLAGQTFDGSVAGELVGAFAPVSVASDAGTYAFDLAPGEAAAHTRQGACI